jgi:adenine-specific DNA glycosylase
MQPKPEDIRSFHTALAHWYTKHGRHDLPWRNTDDPYKIWVSEIMLQQTQVATVEGKYYAPFLKQFPTIQALAKAPRERVMKAWEGLGYYRRAGFLHQAAQQLCAGGTHVPGGASRPRSAPPRSPLLLRSAQSATAGSGSLLTVATQQVTNAEGEASRPSEPSAREAARRVRQDADTRSNQIALPDSLEALLKLPGIGRNTAHAILAFGYHQPYAVMEANVKRVVARIFALAQPKENELWDGAAMLLGQEARSEEYASHEPAKAARSTRQDADVRSKKTMNPFHYNQAMMDIGALICTPKNPKCGECPAANICAGKANPEAYPQKKVKKAIPTKRPHIWVIENQQGEMFLLQRNAALLGGLYGFPQEAAAPPNATLLGEVKHAYSHFKLVASVHHAKGVAAPAHLHNQGAFYSRATIATLPLSRVDLKIMQLLGD